MNKNGLSMISMIIYVVLFFAFSAFAVGMSANMNYRTLSEKGEIINNEQLQKLQYNLLMSAKNSHNIDIISDKIVFSNNDEYTFNKNTNKIYKNGGIIVSDVESFIIFDVKELKSTPVDFALNLDKSLDNICVEVKFSKYSKELTEKIFVTTGDEISEK